MNTYPTNWRPSPGLRFTALFCAVMVVILAIFSASPALHAWLHGYDKVAMPRHEAAAGHNHSASDEDDDGCAIVMFSHGLIAALAGVVAIVAAQRLIQLVVMMRADVHRQSPRYWLPPLCGPPLR